MAAPKKRTSTKRTGKPSAGEPRMQTFTRFGGCNFLLASHPFDLAVNDEDAQSDLQMNFLAIQDNVSLRENGSLQSRENIIDLLYLPAGEMFTGVSVLIGGEIFAASASGKIFHGRLSDGTLSEEVTINNLNGGDTNWTFLGFADNCLVGMTDDYRLWTDPVNQFSLSDALEIPTPDPLSYLEGGIGNNIQAMGELKISRTATEECPHRLSLLYTWVNKYGPTLPSPPLSFYANKPTTEWSALAYLRIAVPVPDDLAVSAVELYYTEDTYQDPAFFGRTDVDKSSRQAIFNWTGYVSDTSMWTIANLTVPTQNYTKGVPASKMVQHDGKLYFWGGTPEYRCWIGGNAGNMFSVSTGTGGGFADADPGTMTKIREVVKFKTTSGSTIVTALTDNPNSKFERRFNLVENNITLSTEQAVKGWQFEHIDGTVGCKSFYGAESAADGLYAISRYGLSLTTLTMEYNTQLRVQYVSDNIKPVFVSQYGNQLTKSVLLSIDDILYMTFGSPVDNLDNIIFCYDIDRKAWYTYSLDMDEAILNMIQIDHEAHQEGIGIFTKNRMWFLPTTKLMESNDNANFSILLETGDLSTVQPLGPEFYLSQLEFRFDRFIGNMRIDVVGIDQFGRKVTTSKYINHDTPQYNLSEFMRIDLVLESYKVTITGTSNFRMTHFIARVYPKSQQINEVWGFNSMQSNTSSGSIHKYFKDYNDLRQAIIP